MEEYIPKSAVVAWALEELKLAEKFYKETESDVYFGKINLLKKQLSFLGTIEVKEVDLKKTIPSIDDILEEEGIDLYSGEAKMIKEAFYKAIDTYCSKEQKGEGV